MEISGEILDFERGRSFDMKDVEKKREESGAER